MKNAMFFVVLSLLLGLNFNAQAQDTKLTAQFFQAYAMNSLPLWEDGIAKMEKSIGADATLAQKLSLAKIYYAAATNYMANNKKETTSELLEKSEELLDAILKQDKKAAEANALLAGVYGLQIALSPMRGMTLGSKSGRLLSTALKEAPDNAIAHHFRGSNLFYTPAMFGGDVAKSIEHLEKARQILEQEKRVSSWEYLATMAILGQAYHNKEQLDKAKTTYKTALAVAPTFGWVKFQLMPALEKDIKAAK